MIWGVCFALLASICFSLSNLLEKRAVDAMSDVSSIGPRLMLSTFARSPVWVAGFVAGGVAAVLMVLGYDLAPIAVVQTIFGAGLVLIVVVSHVYLHESLARREFAGLWIMIVAVVLVSLTLHSTSGPGVGGDETSVLLTSIVSLALALGIYCLLAGVHAGDVSLRFGVTSGLLYGIAALQVKSVAVLLHRRGLVNGVERSLAAPYPYLFVVISVLGLLVFQRGLQRSRIAVIVPLTNVIASVYVVVVGMIVFDESFPRSDVLTALRIVGFALALAGNWLLAVGPLGSRPERRVT
jgi:drug/metabolite transporter (DMT)-like permease